MKFDQIAREMEELMDSASPEPTNNNKIKMSLPLIVALVLTGAIAGALLVGLLRPAPPSAATELIEATEENESKIDAFLFYIGVARVRK